MPTPLKIGLTACFFHPDVNRQTFGKKTLLYMESDMANWVLNNGHIPILLPPPTEKVPTQKLLSFVDGLILQGGADIAPQSYGETPIRPQWAGDPIRDQYEIDLYRGAMAQNIPVLGVCRGAQLINVAHGGTMYQDIPSQLPDSEKHRDPEVYDQLLHEVTWKENSLLGHIYKNSPSTTINTVHHQAIKNIGKDLVIEATSPSDGIIEGLRLNTSQWNQPDQTFVLAVQWHPEFMTGKNYVDPDILMKAYIGEVQSRKKENP